MNRDDRNVKNEGCGDGKTKQMRSQESERPGVKGKAGWIRWVLTGPRAYERVKEHSCLKSPPRFDTTSGLYVVVWFAGPDADQDLQSEVMSGWLRCERRIVGSGGASDEEVMLIEDIRYLRRVGEEGDDESGEVVTGMLRVLDADTEATSAMAVNVARRREKDGALVNDGRQLDGVGDGEIDGGVYTGCIRTAPSPKSPSSSELVEAYMDPQLGSSRLGVGDWYLGGWSFR